MKKIIFLTLFFTVISFAKSTCCCQSAANSCSASFTNANKMLIPEDKNLSADYIKKLFARGKKEIYSGKELDTIGMPCGGIGCGQLYLCGDGSLADWQIFGFAVSRWVSNTMSTFAYQKMRKPVDQGFAVAIKTDDAATPVVKKLNKDGFGYENIKFNGEYPIATISYQDTNFPAKVSMEVFSPFIPLDAKNSSYPATIFNITVQNTSQTNILVSTLGWLENMVAMVSRKSYKIEEKKILKKYKNAEIMFQTVVPVKKKNNVKIISKIFEDFEGTNWGNWKVEGAAPGEKPTTKNHLEGQTTVFGFSGKGYVNTMHGGDKTVGTLTSPEFIINDDYINFLIGGGSGKNVYIALIIDGKEIKKSHGINLEELRWKNWDVKKYKKQKAKIKIVDNETSGWGHINIDEIEFANAPRFGAGGQITNAVDYGNISLAKLDAGSSIDKNCRLQSTTCPEREASRGKFVDLKPGEKKTFSFILTWYFPNKEHGWYYAKRFSSSADVAKHIINNFDYLTQNTRKWRNIYYDSSLPYWLLDRLHSTVSYLATGTAYWRKNGRFYAFEGCTCCRGTCTHVWGYAQTHARLFPSLGRNIREYQDFKPVKEGGGFFPETGLVAFRGGEDRCWFAVDGQCDTILNAYREHLMSSDKTFLKKNYSKIKKALQYLIDQDALGEKGGINSGCKKLCDENTASTNPPNGIIEGTQHNTYDINYHGPNTLVGALYLSALRAGEKMAREMNDEKFAALCSNLYENGSSWTTSNLWNGEYFIQKVDLKKYPNHQYKDGCLSDQLFGQFWAHQVDLGYIYPTNYVRSAMNAIWKYNFAPDIGPYNKKFKPFRWFVQKEGQGGLFTCTWPRGDYLASGTSYKNELWTGIEYEAAAGMIAEGMVTQGLAICKAIHDRYQPGFLNPYNEIECGDHYARAMASWGVYLALAGFQYDGPNGIIGFNPVITPKKFKAAFTFAKAWGVFEQTRGAKSQTDKLTIVKGELEIKELSFGIPKQLEGKNVIIEINGKEEKAGTKFISGKLLITFPKKINVTEANVLEVKI